MITPKAIEDLKQGLHLIYSASEKIPHLLHLDVTIRWDQNYKEEAFQYGLAEFTTPGSMS